MRKPFFQFLFPAGLAPAGSRRLAWLVLMMALILPSPILLAAQDSTAPSPAPASETANRALGDVQQGYSQLAQKNFAGAETSFRAAIASQPKLAEAYHGLGLALWREGKGNDALRELTEAAQLDTTSAALELDLARAAWSMADQARSSNSQTQDHNVVESSYRSLAITEMLKATSLQPKDTQVHLDLAELYLEANEPKDAASQADEATRLDPKNAAPFVILGRAAAAQGNEGQAVMEYEKAIQLNPHDAGSYIAIGELRAQQQDYPDAVKALRSAIQASPGLSEAYAMLGQILEQTHQTAEARAVLERALALDPSDWESAYQLGKILAGAGNAQASMALFQKAVDIHPDFPEAREQLALGLVRRGDLAGAAAQAEIIFRRRPQAPEGHAVMALVSWKQRSYDASLAECALALSSDPRSAQTLALQALDFWQEGRHGEARQAFVAASKEQQDIGSSDAFCRLVACDARDISVVEDFLRKNRWALSPPPDAP